MKISIVIPALDEGELIKATIESCQAAGADEIVVCDGGSRDETQQIAETMNCLLVESKSGRGQQLVAGAKQATGDALVFVHADCCLTDACLVQLRAYLVINRFKNAWGCFQQEIQAPGRRYRWVQKGNAWRASKRGLVYGDQAMWITRDLYDRVGGFAEVPLMEDVIISDQLKKISPPVVLGGPVQVSDRHWKRKGVVRTTLRNWYLYRLFRFGVSPEKLARRYRSA